MDSKGLKPVTRFRITQIQFFSKATFRLRGMFYRVQSDGRVSTAFAW